MNRIVRTGRGRILSWRGGSIWIGWAQASTDFHAHHAIQLGVSLRGGLLHYQAEGQPSQPYMAALIPADLPHAFVARDVLVATIFVEPESREGQVLRERFQGSIASIADHLSPDNCAALCQAYDDKLSDEEIIGRTRRLVAHLAELAAAPAQPVDQRIVRAVELIQQRIDQAISQADIAKAVHLSPERFRHLFVEETGIRFRPYILWLRLGRATDAYAGGASLTDAAYEGGFADAAHFSRTFKRMFGAAPASIEPE